ncbi:lysM and putative peptidoglycan-binding domain-containing protein 2 [Austrofundulus limnaeus]|uniref:LysM and putative peptidoglycan-binding domain-containing protein 2 n=1 Tax=Austrofundulus limnaeus TaxID=52670 RepID=A0A2I4CQ56_AUSLI|nr:PREDICTED: lysM and putative peptidoglycan-binding domain-containing protein 2 [Austrofundulus limnaeus]
MAEFSPVLPTRDHGGGGPLAQPIFPRSRSGSESESELSQSLARTKIRSYGSTATVSTSLGEKFIEHRVSDGDTLQGVALKYGVTMEQIKRANKLFSSDCLFLRTSLNIPVLSEKRFVFNGLSLDSPDGDGSTAAARGSADTPCVVANDVEEEPSPPSSPPPEDSRPPEPEELSARDFLHRLDLQIKQSKQAARRLKEEEVRSSEEKLPASESSSYQEN